MTQFIVPNLQWLACATCMGDPNDPNVIAASWAILFMLGVLIGVFGMFVVMVRKMVTSARRNAANLCVDAPASELVADAELSRPSHPIGPVTTRSSADQREYHTVS